MQLLLATTNAGKLQEIRKLLSDIPVELLTLDDGPPVETPEETGATFGENARLKASYYASLTGRLTVAEDSGLEIDQLDGAPGVQSARFGGVDSSYPEKFALIYEQLGQVNRGSAASDQPDGAAGRSAARFVCSLAVADGTRIVFEARGEVEGEIAPEPKGSGGFGYDPIFFYPPFGCTLAEAGERKAAISHRGNAFRHLRSWLISQVLRSSPPP